MYGVDSVTESTSSPRTSAAAAELVWEVFGIFAAAAAADFAVVGVEILDTDRPLLTCPFVSDSDEHSTADSSEDKSIHKSV